MNDLENSSDNSKKKQKILEKVVSNIKIKDKNNEKSKLIDKTSIDHKIEKYSFRNENNKDINNK